MEIYGLATVVLCPAVLPCDVIDTMHKKFTSSAAK